MSFESRMALVMDGFAVLALCPASAVDIRSDDVAVTDAIDRKLSQLIPVQCRIQTEGPAQAAAGPSVPAAARPSKGPLNGFASSWEPTAWRS